MSLGEGRADQPLILTRDGELLIDVINTGFSRRVLVSDS